MEDLMQRIRCVYMIYVVDVLVVEEKSSVSSG